MTVSPVNKPRIDDFDTPIRPIQHHRIAPPKEGSVTTMVTRDSLSAPSVSDCHCDTLGFHPAL